MQVFSERSGTVKKFGKFLAVSCVFCIAVSGCVYETGVSDTAETTMVVTSVENIVKTNRQAVGNSFEEFAEAEPFSSYSYTFSAYGSNYMITVTPDETHTGLTLTVEDNTFGFSTFEVTPPQNYAVYIPYSQQYASSVCTVIKSSDSSVFDTDMLKIDFYLDNFSDESLPYTVSRLYSIVGNKPVQLQVYDAEKLLDGNNNEETKARTPKMTAKSGEYLFNLYEELDYIPESCLYQTEPLKFMPPPEVYTDENGRLNARVVTYTLDPDNMVFCRSYEDVAPDSVYYGYAAHAVAGEIYRYFIAASLNVTDYENFVKVEEDGHSYNLFKVDDPRFSTVNELRDYVSQYFSEDMVEEMFRGAPQKYRDIDGQLYTVLGDGGADETLGQLTISDFSVQDNIYTYRTKQEKFNENREMSYINGGDFVIEVKSSGSFVVRKYRYPYL